MQCLSFRVVILVCIALTTLGLVYIPQAQAEAWIQQTATSTHTAGVNPVGSIAIVNSDDQEEINVRSGPGTDYTLVGKLLAGQQVPALGRSPGGDWVQISFPGVPDNVAWVYAYLVTVNGALPVVEPPPTPAPLISPTVDQTLAAQFIREIPPTRLPTFTPPPPLVIPT
ncbi:MAG: SH3 domain-containing protein, partial [Chloroflexota bacterium]